MIPMLASASMFGDKACEAAGRSKFAPCFPGRLNPSSEGRAR
jgi:hypothetical protein